MDSFLSTLKVHFHFTRLRFEYNNLLAYVEECHRHEDKLLPRGTSNPQKPPRIEQQHRTT